MASLRGRKRLKEREFSLGLILPETGIGSSAVTRFTVSGEQTRDGRALIPVGPKSGASNSGEEGKGMRARALILAQAIFCMAGCIQGQRVIKVNADGSGSQIGYGARGTVQGDILSLVDRRGTEKTRQESNDEKTDPACEPWSRHAHRSVSFVSAPDLGPNPPYRAGAARKSRKAASCASCGSPRKCYNPEYLNAVALGMRLNRDKTPMRCRRRRSQAR